MSKRPVKKCMNDLCPIAVTAVPMNVSERLFLKHLKPLVVLSLHPLQFSYTANPSCEDAILALLQHLYPHLEHSDSSSRVMFFIFHPHLTPYNNTLMPKNSKINIPHGFIHWMLTHLTNRTQFVCLDINCCSNVIITNTCAPQGSVHASFIFTLHTAYCGTQDVTYPLITFADDTAMTGLIRNNDDTKYRLHLK